MQVYAKQPSVLEMLPIEFKDVMQIEYGGVQWSTFRPIDTQRARREAGASVCSRMRSVRANRTSVEELS